MKEAQYVRAHELFEEIQANLRVLHAGGFYDVFMRAQRETWARVQRCGKQVRGLVDQLLLEEGQRILKLQNEGRQS